MMADKDMTAEQFMAHMKRPLSLANTYSGSRYQRGHGIGGFFSKLLRFAVPVMHGLARGATIAASGDAKGIAKAGSLFGNLAQPRDGSGALFSTKELDKVTTPGKPSPMTKKKKPQKGRGKKGGKKATGKQKGKGKGKKAPPNKQKGKGGKKKTAKKKPAKGKKKVAATVKNVLLTPDIFA